MALDRPAARACKPARRCIEVSAFTQEDEAVLKGMIRDELDSTLRDFSAARFDQLIADLQEIKLDQAV
ncbi:hypothetical protein OEZ85_008934 [Tetradesmus obliquus]|uniref:Uncharacterized protein n=1 Tax=Tetradesmus obliquus TaxID=3088 RepID=A0ABY8TK95_TETOB|nr:hypothetical protein OEZ85_008934 [Tetradesmus obliquus]